MFNLRFFSPFIFILLVIVGFFHFLWLPSFIEFETETQIEHEKEILRLLGDAIVSSLLSADYAELYAVMDQVRNRHETFEVLELFHANGSRLYPLEQKAMTSNASIPQIEQKIVFRGDEVGILRARINIREYIEHEIKEVQEFELLVIGLLLVLIGVTAYLQYRWVNTPLKQLSNATSRISQGDYDVALPKGNSKDISVLIKSFVLLQKNLKKRESQLARRKEIEETIRDIQTYFITVADKYLTFQKILDHIIYLTGSQIGLIGEIGHEEDSAYLDVYAITNLAWDVESRKMYEQSIEGKLRFPGTNNLFGEVVKTGQVVISGDPKNDSRSGGFPKGHPELDNFLGVPLYNSKSRLVGMVGVANSHDGYAEADVQKLDVLWLAIGNLIDAQREHRALLEREEELTNMRQELVEANETLEGLVRTDSLTGIANRRYFDEMLDKEFNRAYRQEQPLALILFDIDQFKAYNDHYGHSLGDQALIKVAQAAAAIFQRSGELVARYGGEEFVIILPYNDLVAVSTMAERLLEAVRELQIPHEASAVSDRVTISAGIASIQPDRKSLPADLIVLADKALYEAKQTGRDRLVVAQENLT